MSLLPPPEDITIPEESKCGQCGKLLQPTRPLSEHRCPLHCDHLWHHPIESMYRTCTRCGKRALVLV